MFAKERITVTIGPIYGLGFLKHFQLFLDPKDFHYVYNNCYSECLLLCSTEDSKSYRFGTTWVWLNDYNMHLWVNYTIKRVELPACMLKTIAVPYQIDILFTICKEQLSSQFLNQRTQKPWQSRISAIKLVLRLLYFCQTSEKGLRRRKDM